MVNMAMFNSTPRSASSTDPFGGGNVTMTSSVDNSSSVYENVTEVMMADSAAGASIVSPIVMFLAGLIGNVLALVVLHKTKTEIRSMMFYTLVAALTWNDLVGILLTSPPVLAAYLNQRQMPALPTLCRFHALAMVCFGLSTPFIVCTMAIERSLALKCSYFYSKYCTPSSARVVVAMLWAFVLFFGALPLLGVGSFTLQYPKTWCFLHFRSYVPLDMAYAGAYAVLNLLVIFLMIFCNGLVMTTLCRVRKSRRRLSNASASGTLLKSDAVEEEAKPPQHLRRRHHRDVELQMIWLLCAITTIFSVCWAPLMIYILFCLQSPHNHSPVFGLVAVRLASLNQTLNPWIYVILRKSLLSRLAHLCRYYCCWCRADADSIPSQLSEPRKPTQFHPPPIVLKPQGNPGTSPKKKYVHVGHQLCPSSQFVGRHMEVVRLVPESKVFKGRKSGSGSASRREGECRRGSCREKYVSETEQAWGEDSGTAVCSACRTRVMPGEERREDPVRPHSLSSSHPPSAHSCSHVISPPSSTVCEDSTEEARPAPSLPTDGIYVDLFRHLPASDVSLPNDVTQNDVSTTTPYRPQTGRGEGAAANVHSFVSEADDHGYSSKVSTDSSRMSTPERSHPMTVADDRKRDKEIDLTKLEVEIENCQTPVPDSSDRHTAAANSSSQESHPSSQESHPSSQESHPVDLKENHLTQNGGVVDVVNYVDGSSKATHLEEDRSRHDSSTENRDKDLTGHSKDDDTQQNDNGDVVNISAAACAVNDKQVKGLRINDQLSKQNACFRDNSLDFTSGVFDCRDGTDDDDDVYGEGGGHGAVRGPEDEVQGTKRDSTSRTMSTSSAGTLMESSSGQDTTTVYCRHLSSSSGH